MNSHSDALQKIERALFDSRDRRRAGGTNGELHWSN
jgi:hypothetical protein